MRYTPIAPTNHHTGPLQRGRLLACTLGHAVSDGFANFTPPLFHTVKTLYRLSDGDIGLISMMFSLTTNFGQPVFGYLIDRYRLRNIIPFALGLATVFMCVVGFAPNVWVFTGFMMLSGLGISLFHPRGGALAAEAAGRRRAFGMSIFGAGGAVGYALASLAAPLLHDLGLRVGLKPLQGLVFALPLGLMVVAFLWRNNPQQGSLETRQEQPVFSLRRHLFPHLRPLLPLFLVMVLRSSTSTAFATFIQVLQGDRGQTEFFQGLVLFMFVGGAALGGMTGSYLSDRLGRRCITVISLLLAPPLLYAALYASPLATVVLLFFAGFTLRGAEHVNIAQTQDLLPHGMSMASAISMGFTWGIAGLAPSLVGLVSAATHNLAWALATTTVLPIIAALVALSLPTRAPTGPLPDTPASQ